MKAIIRSNTNYLENLAKVPVFVDGIQVAEVQKVSTGFIPIVYGRQINQSGQTGFSSILNIVPLGVALERVEKYAAQA
jgi:hypothetical protein